MDPGASMMAYVVGSTHIPQEATKTCNCRPSVINFCPRTPDLSTTMEIKPLAVTMKDMKSLTNIFSSFNVGSTKKHARKKAKTAKWRETIRVHKQTRAEKKLVRKQQKADKTAKREEKLQLKYGEAYVDPSDVLRKGSIVESMDLEEKKHQFDEDDYKADSIAEGASGEDAALTVVHPMVVG